MSSSGPRREVAYRVFADEFDDSYYTYAESDEERAPNYLVTPTGARVNRLFVVGVLTEVEDVSDDVVRARVVDPTGAFVVYAGQYQPEALAFFERASPPTFVALTGKARTFQPEGSDRVFTSIRPETVNEVDAETRDRWVVQTAEHTLERVAIFGKALSHPASGAELRRVLENAGVQSGVAAGIPRAIEEYGTTQHYLSSIQEMAIDAARLVAGEIDAVDREPIAPDDPGDATVDTGFADEVALDAVESADRDSEGDDSDGPPGDLDAGQVTDAEKSEPEGEGTETAESAESRSEEAESEEAGLKEAESKGTESEGAKPEVEETEIVAPEDGQVDDADEDEESGARESVESDMEASREVDPEGGQPPVDPGEADPGLSQNGESDELERTDEMYELSAEERAEVEEKYDVGFESGAEIDAPADDENAEEPRAASEDSGSAIEEVGDSGAALEEAGDAENPPIAEDEPEAEPESEPPEVGSVSEEELEDVVVETMKAEGDDEGISRSALVDQVTEAYGVDESAVEDAIQDALLGGRCFESGEDTLKPI